MDFDTLYRIYLSAFLHFSAPASEWTIAERDSETALAAAALGAETAHHGKLLTPTLFRERLAGIVRREES